MATCAVNAALRLRTKSSSSALASLTREGFRPVWWQLARTVITFGAGLTD
jgi:hypothetical protein